LKFILLVEGDTEHIALPEFFKRWLDPKLDQRVGIRSVNFGGSGEYLKGVAYQKCPRLRQMLDEMLRLAKNSGN